MNLIVFAKLAAWIIFIIFFCLLEKRSQVMQFSESRSVIFWVVCNLTLVKFIYAELLNTITHAFNMLRPCDNYRPRMEHILFRYYDRWIFLCFYFMMNNGRKLVIKMWNKLFKKCGNIIKQVFHFTVLWSVCTDWILIFQCFDVNYMVSGAY